LLAHKAKNVGNVAEGELLVEAILLPGIVVSFGAMPCECFGLSIVVEMFEFPLTQLAVEGQPLLVKLLR
jgi:hypothetical protein